jgi:hypothetical protein
MELELENTIIGSASKNALKIHKKTRFEYWMTEIDLMENKLKDINYRDHGKSCLRMEYHTNGIAHFLCDLHDIPFLGMIYHGLYNFCLLACFL